MPRDEAVKFCGDLKQGLKVEHIQTGLAEHPAMSFYRQGEFVDLCRGPHIPDAGRIKAFKLLSVAGSYWKGDANNAIERWTLPADGQLSRAVRNEDVVAREPVSVRASEARPAPLSRQK